MKGTQGSQIHRDRRQNGDCQGLEEGSEGASVMGTKFQFEKIKNF